MVVRARSLAAVLTGLAAFPLAAHAKQPGPGGTPSFSCNADGVVSGINWGDTSLGSPMVTVDQLPAIQFGCGNNMYSTGGISGNDFAINFGLLLPAVEPQSIKLDIASADYKLFTFNADGIKIGYQVTDFDLYLGFQKVDTFTQDFIGVQVSYKLDLGSAQSPHNMFFLNSKGELIFDPPIPGGFGVISLYDSPRIPEPSSLALLGTGLLGVGGAVRRRLGL